jgi:hypothetical protein
MPNITYNGETFYLSDNWGWLNADFISVSADLNIKINEFLIAEAKASFGN